VVVAVVVAPVPIGAFVGVAALVEVHVVAVGIALPLDVKGGLTIPCVVVVIVGVVDTSVYGTACDEQRGCEYRGEEGKADTKSRAHSTFLSIPIRCGKT